MPLTPFRIPTRVLIEDGCRSQLPEIAQELGAKRLLLVSDPGLASCGAVDAMADTLRSSSLELEVFLDVESNPRVGTVEAIAERAQATDLIVGLGGGSVVDAAKAAAMLATNGGSLIDYVGTNRFKRPPLPFVAIPTTCGTGSEVTWVAVITDEKRRSKISIKGDAMFPTVALVDSELLRDLPAHLIASTGMDALTHALEATTGLPRNPVSDALAESAIGLLIKMLPRAVQNPSRDHAARSAVMRASTLAGLAFGNTDVGGVHCLSETLGGMIDVAHGLANAMLLTPVMRYHQPYIQQRLADLNGSVCGGRPDADAFLSRIEALGQELEIPSFSTLGVSEDQWPEIAQRAAANGSNASNPQVMEQQNYLEILKALD
ncbi:MAG: alcohol dehydrogenase [Planctomycetota bacterium]|jgi:alcohol dehydrogenase